MDNTGYSKLRELRVAGILDELSRTCFPYECRFLELDTKNWEKQIISFQPQMLFIESAWKGLDNKWYKKIYNVSDELIGVVNLCKCMGIPTVFWNKEDPVHFDTFISAAALFDYIYTTDADCIPKYKYLLGHDRVGLLPLLLTRACITRLKNMNAKTAVALQEVITENRESAARILKNIQSAPQSGYGYYHI